MIIFKWIYAHILKKAISIYNSQSLIIFDSGCPTYIFRFYYQVIEGKCDFTGDINTLMQRQGIVLQSLPKFTSRSLSGSRITTFNRVVKYQNVAQAVSNVWGWWCVRVQACCIII